MKTAMVGWRCVLGSVVAGLALGSPAAIPPDIRVSANRHFLETVDGKPFFYLADTAWELFAKYFTPAETGIRQSLTDKYWPRKAE